MPSRLRRPAKRVIKKPANPLFELEESTQAVDAQMFLWCSGVYSAAAHLSMPVENPGARPAFKHKGKVYGFSDIPINRGMLAATKELRERGVNKGQTKATLTRLMHFGEIFDHRDRLQAFIKPGDEPDAVSLSEALIKACASAKFIMEDDKLRFDIEDIARIAQKLTDEEEATSSSDSCG